MNYHPKLQANGLSPDITKFYCHQYLLISFPCSTQQIAPVPGIHGFDLEEPNSILDTNTANFGDDNWVRGSRSTRTSLWRVDKLIVTGSCLSRAVKVPSQAQQTNLETLILSVLAVLRTWAARAGHGGA